jgi:hypothetical protein
LAADYLIWNAEAAVLADALAEAIPSDLGVEQLELVLSGTASTLAREQFEALGVAVTERAFEPVGGDSAQLSEPPP